jgi:radical SAM protein with 4Fe4S-binding SPASM domain
VLDQLADLGCLYVSFSGGEPLVRKDFFRIAQYAREKNFALRLMTNGALVDRRIARHLNELNFECVDVSIYGMNAATHDHFTRRPSSFKKTVAGIRHLKEAGIDVRLKMTINRYNASQLKAVRRLARNLGAEFQAEPYITPRSDCDPSPLAHRITRRQAESVARYITSVNAYYYRKEHGSVGSVCNAARCLLAISPFGDVYPCEGMQIPAGNVRRQPLAKIWRNATVLAKIRSLRARDFKECFGCSLEKYCFRCMGLAYLETGSYANKAEIFCMMARAVHKQLQ